MKFLDIFAYVLVAFTLLLTGMVIAQSGTWSPVLSGALAWVTQSIAFSILVVAAACMICKKGVRDLSPWTIFWAIFLSGFVMLATVAINSAGKPNVNVWPSLLELAAFIGIQIALFTIPRSYYYD